MSAAAAPSEVLPEALIDVALRCVAASGPILKRYFRTPVAVDVKPDASPVTVADREAEAAIRAVLDSLRPEDGILGEEEGSHGLDAEYVWVIDPIDGTKSFMTGRPIFGTLLGLLHHGRPVLGVIDQPILGDRWIGASGHGTRWNDTPARVRPCPRMADATLTATTPAMFDMTERVGFDRVSAGARYTLYGSDCYGYGLLAGGYTDLVIESALGVWDWVALVPVVEGAGGVMTGWDGSPLRLGSPGRVVAAGDARVHAEALRLLAG